MRFFSWKTREIILEHWIAVKTKLREAAQKEGAHEPLSRNGSTSFKRDQNSRKLKRESFFINGYVCPGNQDSILSESQTIFKWFASVWHTLQQSAAILNPAYEAYLLRVLGHPPHKPGVSTNLAFWQLSNFSIKISQPRVKNEQCRKFTHGFSLPFQIASVWYKSEIWCFISIKQISCAVCPPVLLGVECNTDKPRARGTLRSDCGVSSLNMGLLPRGAEVEPGAGAELGRHLAHLNMPIWQGLPGFGVGGPTTWQYPG